MTYPIDSPEYSKARRRLERFIRGRREIHMEEPEYPGRNGKTFHVRPGNPCVEGFLPPELHLISTVRVRDLP